MNARARIWSNYELKKRTQCWSVIYKHSSRHECKSERKSRYDESKEFQTIAKIDIVMMYPANRAKEEKENTGAEG